MLHIDIVKLTLDKNSEHIDKRFIERLCIMSASCAGIKIDMLNCIGDEYKHYSLISFNGDYYYSVFHNVEKNEITIQFSFSKDNYGDKFLKLYEHFIKILGESATDIRKYETNF